MKTFDPDLHILKEGCNSSDLKINLLVCQYNVTSQLGVAVKASRAQPGPHQNFQLERSVKHCCQSDAGELTLIADVRLMAV